VRGVNFCFALKLMLLPREQENPCVKHCFLP